MVFDQAEDAVMELPREEVMRQMAKLAIENATTFFADMARQFAGQPIMSALSGKDALLAFAEAIEKRNHDVYGGAGKS